MAKLATRLERLEKRLGATDEMRYQEACRQHYLLWMPHFSAALEKRMPWEALAVWDDENPPPQRQWAATPQEMAEAERIRQEILDKLEETRRRLKMWAPELFAEPD